MKKIKIAMKLKASFSLQGFYSNFYVLCMNAIVCFLFCLRIYMHCTLNSFKTYLWYENNIWLPGDAFVVEGLARFLCL
jgi:hypothetical protein